MILISLTRTTGTGRKRKSYPNEWVAEGDGGITRKFQFYQYIVRCQQVADLLTLPVDGCLVEDARFVETTIRFINEITNRSALKTVVRTRPVRIYYDV